MTLLEKLKTADAYLSILDAEHEARSLIQSAIAEVEAIQFALANARAEALEEAAKHFDSMPSREMFGGTVADEINELREKNKELAQDLDTAYGANIEYCDAIDKLQLDAKAIRAEALEEAAKVCDDESRYSNDAECCAAVIRGLK